MKLGKVDHTTASLACRELIAPSISLQLTDAGASGVIGLTKLDNGPGLPRSVSGDVES